MYFAHAQELHTVAASHSTNQLLCIVCAVLLSAAVLTIFVVLDIRRKRATEKVKIKN